MVQHWKEHDDVIKWKHFPHYWPFVRGIHRSPVNSPHKGQWRGALMFTLICARINGWVNNREAGDLRRYLAHYDVIVMKWAILIDVIELQINPVKYLLPWIGKRGVRHVFRDYIFKITTTSSKGQWLVARKPMDVINFCLSWAIEVSVSPIYQRFVTREHVTLSGMAQ